MYLSFYRSQTILAAYDHVKLTEYIDQTEEGRVLELVELDPTSLATNITQAGV
jgi:hypothetical protein